MATAREALRHGDHVRALAAADQLAALAPEDPAACTMRAEVLLHADAGEEALSEARRATELAPKDARVHVFLGLAAWRSERLTLAQESLEKAIELSGGNRGMLVDYAWFMAVERGARLAEDAALEAVAANESSSTAWAALGLVQFRLHEHDRAEESLNRALGLDSTDPYAQSAMILLLHDRGDDSKVEDLLELLEETPGVADTVEKTRRDILARRLAGLLVERGVTRVDPWDRRRYAASGWLVVTLALVCGMCAVFRPTSAVGVSICVIMPLSIYWLVRQMID